MYVTKRNGEREPVKFDKVVLRIKKQTYDLNTDYETNNARKVT